MTTTDDFTNAEVIYERSLAKIKERLALKPGEDKYVPIVTGFLGRGAQTGAITTLGRGGSDLSATVLGAALELPEVQVRRDTNTQTIKQAYKVHGKSHSSQSAPTAPSSFCHPRTFAMESINGSN